MDRRDESRAKVAHKGLPGYLKKFRFGSSLVKLDHGYYEYESSVVDRDPDSLYRGITQAGVCARYATLNK